MAAIGWLSVHQGLASATSHNRGLDDCVASSFTPHQTANEWRGAKNWNSHDYDRDATEQPHGILDQRIHLHQLLWWSGRRRDNTGHGVCPLRRALLRVVVVRSPILCVHHDPVF